jgi:hypothetical protein
MVALPGARRTTIARDRLTLMTTSFFLDRDASRHGLS